jgi:hypothetical protein
MSSSQEIINPTFSEKTLTIPGYVLPQDVNYIQMWFKNFDIATVKSVEYHDHEEPEYNAEDKPYFGYVIIEIDEWYDNACSRNFYEKIKNLDCKIVYDDPDYWEVEFYDYDKYYKNSHPQSESLQISLPEDDSTTNKDEDENIDNEQSSCSSVESDYEEEEDDIEKDPDYVYQDTDDELDINYEYNYQLTYYQNFDKKKSKTKKQKCNHNTDNDEVYKNKNYMKRNKRKDFNNVWARRLRQKHA